VNLAWVVPLAHNKEQHVRPSLAPSYSANFSGSNRRPADYETIPGS
jgi:hypothetical protein